MAESTLQPLVAPASISGTAHGPRPIWLEFWIVRGDAWTSKRAKRDQAKGWRQAAPVVIGTWRELVPSLAVAQAQRELAALRRAPKGGPIRFRSGRVRKPAIVRALACALADWGAPVGAEEIARLAELLAGEYVDRRLIVRTLAADGWIAPWTYHHFARYVRAPAEAWARVEPPVVRPAPRPPRPRKRAQRSLRATARAMARAAPNAR